MTYNNDSEYYNIARLSKEIAIKIGRKIYEEGYYSDEYVGNTYEQDKLKISYNCRSNYPIIKVFIDNIEVLDCDMSGNRIDYIDGRWTQIIEYIYQQIPNILRQREIQQEDTRQKIQELNTLKEDFKYCVECDKKKSGEFEVINSELNTYGINIIKDQRHNYTTNPIQGYTEDHPYYVFVVYYENEKVAEFGSNPFDIFPNLSYYAKQFKRGDWTSMLRCAISQAKNINESNTRNKVDNSAAEMIKRFKNGF